jgi:ribosomal protein L11 methyltransferase
LELKNKKVFDYGCGTGVLSIMASLLGAESIYAIDIDEWSAENIGENTALNGVRNVTFEKGDLSVVKYRKFDVVLANINKNILLMSFRGIAEMLNKNGTLLISGFYENDLEDLKKEAQNHRLMVVDYLTKNEWCAAQLKLI